MERTQVEEAFRAVANRNEITRERWLELRCSGIGGSDAAAVCGISPWGSPLSVYAEKVGVVQAEERPELRWGTLLEPLIRQEFPREYEEQEGASATTQEYPHLLQSVRYPWMIADLDGLVEIQGEGRGGLEIKTANILQGRYWQEGELPDHYYAQVQHYMGVTDLPYFMVVALVGKNLIWRMVPRNREYIDKLIEIERDFWTDYVQEGRMPLPGGDPADREALRSIYWQSEDEYRDLSEMDGVVAEYQTIGLEMKRLQRRKFVLGDKIRAALGSAKTGLCGGVKITWSRYETRRVDGKALKRDHPDMYQQYSRTSRSDRLTLSERKEKE